jgi:hypothetical protein
MAAHPEFVSVLLDCLLPVARVPIADVQEDLLKAALQQIEEAGGGVIAVQTNFTDRRQVEKWVEETVSRYGRPDGAANLAGVVGKTIGVMAVEDIDDDDWNFVLGEPDGPYVLPARAVEENGGEWFDRQRGQCSWLDGQTPKCNLRRQQARRDRLVEKSREGDGKQRNQSERHCAVSAFYLERDTRDII